MTKKEAKTARKVGDVHPNHPTWIWTEYKPGKFDWRTNPADKKQGQRTDKATNKKVAKGGKVEKEAPKELTIDEFVALPTKSAKTNKKPSEAQKEALKLINKGYRITTDKKFFENAEGDKKACNWESVVAMLRRYGIEYIPEGLVKVCNMDGNLAMANALEVTAKAMLEAAYLAGYEPSEAVTTADEEIAEAMEYLTNQDVRL